MRSPKGFCELGGRQKETPRIEVREKGFPRKGAKRRRGPRDVSPETLGEGRRRSTAVRDSDEDERARGEGGEDGGREESVLRKGRKRCTQNG